jgi:glucokinase
MTPTAESVVAVVIDSGRLSAGIVSSDGDVLVRDRVGTPGREVWRSLEQIVLRILAARPDDVALPTAVGVSCAGPIDVAAGSVSPAAIPAWVGFTLRDHLAELTGLPVHLDTLAGAAAIAEQWVGEAVDVPSFALVMLDQTIESAVVVGGVRLRGAHGNAGSIAHMLVEPGGATCACGAAGCLSAYACTTALETEMNRPMRRATRSIIERTGIMIGRAIASGAAAFDVTTFFVGGAVIDTFGDPVLDAIRRELASRAHLSHLAELQVVELSGFGQPLVAAASVALFRTGREGLDPE